jgi:hypothetical protein
MLQFQKETVTNLETETHFFHTAWPIIVFGGRVGWSDWKVYTDRHFINVIHNSYIDIVF